MGKLSIQPALTPSSESDRWGFFRARPWLVPVLLAVLFVPLKVFGWDLSYLNIHAARDWERGWQMYHGVRAWWHGPELLFGSSIPGAFFNLLVGLFHIGGRNPEFAAIGLALLQCLSIGFFCDGLRRVWPLWIAVYATVLYACFPLSTVVLRYLWNPSYLFLFGSLGFWCVIRAVTDRQARWFAGALLVIMLAAQVHMTAWFMLPALILVIVVSGLYPGWKSVLLALIIPGTLICLYLWDQSRQDWHDLAAQALNRNSEAVDVLRLRPNPKFLPVFAMQILVQIPDHNIWPQTFPFSYFERFYQFGRFNRAIGWLAFALSVPAVLLMLQAVRGFVYTVVRKFSLIRNPDYLVLLYSIAVMVLVSAPHIVWNQEIKAVSHLDPNVGVPVRYFLAMWPMQFVLVAAGLAALQRHVRLISVIRLLLLATAISGAAMAVQFHRTAYANGSPFRYLMNDNTPIHPMKDKLAASRFLVEVHRLTFGDFLKRVHTQPRLFSTPEESIDFEFLTMEARHQSIAKANPEHYFFLYHSPDLPYITGDYEVIDREEFGTIGVLVYKPNRSLKDWRIDPPRSMWW